MLVTFLTIGAIVFVGSGAAYAVSETDTAVAYLVEHGIYTGDNNGNLNLDKSLTRAELAVIMTRLEFLNYPNDWEMWGEARFSDRVNCYNKFTDVPDWAFPYVEYCYQCGLVNGVSETQFNPQGTVTPQMACTVLLRYCRITPVGETPDWSYKTAIAKAQSIGIAPSEGLNGSVITRGTVAIIAYRSVQFAEARSAAYNTDTQQIIATAPPVTTTPAVSEQTTASATDMTIDEIRMEIVRLTNVERAKVGAPELQILPELMDCAQAKSQDMVDNDYFEHISPTYGWASTMIRSFVPQATGDVNENIHSIGPWWSNPAQHMFDGWMNSPGHRANLLDPKWTHIGVGIAMDAGGGYYGTQQFVQL